MLVALPGDAGTRGHARLRSDSAAPPPSGVLEEVPEVGGLVDDHLAAQQAEACAKDALGLVAVVGSGLSAEVRQPLAKGAYEALTEHAAEQLAARMPVSSSAGARARPPPARAPGAPRRVSPQPATAPRPDPRAVATRAG